MDRHTSKLVADQFVDSALGADCSADHGGKSQADQLRELPASEIIATT